MINLRPMLAAAVLLAATVSGCPMSTDACADVEGLELSAECPLAFQGTSDDGGASACYLRHVVQVDALERAEELGCCLPRLDESAPADDAWCSRGRAWELREAIGADGTCEELLELSYLDPCG